MLPKKKNIIVAGFFILLLGLGLTIYKDYGIAWDEGAQRRIGEKVFDYVIKGDRFLLTFADKYYGTAVEIPLMMVEKVLKLDNFRSVFLMRHLATFLFFYVGVFFFYLLVKNRLQSWKWGLLGSLLLVLSPRIFADSFYNSKDIPFLSVFIIGIYALVDFLAKKNYSRAISLGIINALLIDIRIGGIFLSFLTLLIVIIELLSVKKITNNHKPFLACFLIYFFFLVIFTVLFWPILWNNPASNFINAISKMKHYNWDLEVLYLGQYLKPYRLPWHYIPVWIGITTPFIYILLFFSGILAFIIDFIKNLGHFYPKLKNDLIFVLWFFLPLLSVISLRSVLYDGWRQMYFIYPAFLLIALIGLNNLRQFIQIKFRGTSYKIISFVLIFALTLSLLDTAFFMIRYHPFQNVFFNRLTVLILGEVRDKFELDYWGLSYRQALEYILKNDNGRIIKVCAANYPGKFNANIFKPEEKSRLKFVDKPEEAKYFLSNYRWHREDYPYKNKVYSIRVRGTEILTVYKMNADDV